MFFFFQAEDGIRDTSVLEFRRVLFRSRLQAGPQGHRRHQGGDAEGPPRRRAAGDASPRRSEERRVGKECRARWARCREKKNHGKEHNGDDAAEKKTESLNTKWVSGQ